MSTRYDLAARIQRVLDEAAEAWEDAGKTAHDYAFAVHTGTVPRCADCGEWGSDFAAELGHVETCTHPRSARQDWPCFLLTTQGGETLAMTPEIAAALLHDTIWLAGHTPAALGRGPAYSTTQPIAVLYLTQIIAPSLDEVIVQGATLRSRITVHDLPHPLIFTSPVRPRCLPL